MKYVNKILNYYKIIQKSHKTVLLDYTYILITILK